MKELTAQELVAIWNARKGVNQSLKTKDGDPSECVKTIQAIIDGENGKGAGYAAAFVDWMTSGEKKDDSRNKYIRSCLAYGWSSERREFDRDVWPAIESAEPEKKPAEAAPQTDALTSLSQAIVGLMGEKLGEEIVGSAKKRLDEYIEGKTLIKLVAKEGKPTIKLDGVVHEKFDEILGLANVGIPVMMVGPAGSGKNVIVAQICKALGFEMYFTNCVTQEYKLTGFVDGMGNYQPTSFYKWAKSEKPAVFFLDELDGSDPSALLNINAAIANHYFEFPNRELVRINPESVVIAAANTFGTGATMEYIGRNQLDAASLNRFAVVKVGYDPRIEEANAGGNADVLGFCREFRKCAERNGLQTVVSYRNISQLARAIDVAGIKPRDAIEACVTKGIDKDRLKSVCSSMGDGVAYKRYLKELAE